MRGIAIIAMLLVIRGEAQEQQPIVSHERKLWLEYMDKVARPVLYHLAKDELKEKMPVELSERTDNSASRSQVAYLEAFGRTLSGMAPWLNLEGGDLEEVTLRKEYREWALRGVANATNPAAKDYMVWDKGQSLVDASFLAFAFLRSPWLWEHLSQGVQKQVIAALEKTRGTVPVYSNWILFSGLIEAFFCKYHLDYDPVRIEYAIREFANHWYVGDGMFSDGMDFHMDYYNSIVIHPFLAAILQVMNTSNHGYTWFASRFDTINKRYAVILERLINTDGSYPVLGRSITYRAGVFHHLADMALRKSLPPSLSPGQVRCALSAVMKRTLDGPSTFNSEGWLNMGLYGRQPGLAEFYITTGSLYLCSEIFLPLGLPDTDPFWAEPDQPWTAVKIWKGMDVPADHALDLR
jgi:hypothetical protein